MDKHLLERNRSEASVMIRNPGARRSGRIAIEKACPSEPDPQEILHSLSVFLWKEIRASPPGSDLDASLMDLALFDERWNRLDGKKLGKGVRLHDVESFLGRLCVEVPDTDWSMSLILALIFYHRAFQSKLVLNQFTWRRIFVISFILAMKVSEDLSIYLEDFLDLLPESNIQDLTHLEMKVLSLLHYDVEFTANDYVDCYFALRSSHGQQAEPCVHFGLKNGKTAIPSWITDNPTSFSM